MNTNLRTRIAAAFLAAGATVAVVAAAPTPAAHAAGKASVTVTIQAQGTDLSGTVSSTSSFCESERKVVVFKQVGTRGGGDDTRFASDTSDSNGSWNTGNTGTEGKFYAKVAGNEFCKRDFSPTITATR